MVEDDVINHPENKCLKYDLYEDSTGNYIHKCSSRSCHLHHIEHSNSNNGYYCEEIECENRIPATSSPLCSLPNGEPDSEKCAKFNSTSCSRSCVFNYGIIWNEVSGGYVCDALACDSRLPDNADNNPGGANDGRCTFVRDFDDNCFAFDNHCYSLACPEHSVETFPNSRICESIPCGNRIPNSSTNSCGSGKNSDTCGFLDEVCIPECPSAHYENVDGICVFKQCELRHYNESAGLMCGEDCVLASTFDPDETGDGKDECLQKCTKPFEIGNEKGICNFTENCTLREYAKSEEYWCGIECWFSLGSCAYSCDSGTEIEGNNKNCSVKEGFVINIIYLGGDGSVDEYNCGIGNNMHCKNLAYTVKNRLTLAFLNNLPPIVEVVGTAILSGNGNITGISIRCFLFILLV
jgi:hypothetical protein